jgi:hypothetical protein
MTHSRAKYAQFGADPAWTPGNKLVPDVRCVTAPPPASAAVPKPVDDARVVRKNRGDLALFSTLA